MVWISSGHPYKILNFLSEVTHLDIIIIIFYKKLELFNKF